MPDGLVGQLVSILPNFEAVACALRFLGCDFILV